MDIIILNWTDPLTGMHRRQQFSLPLRIGRRSSNDVILCDAQVSRYHAELRRDGQSIVIADLQSANGTYVDGRRIDEACLTDGAVLRIGATILTFSVGVTEQRASVIAPAAPVSDLLVIDAPWHGLADADANASAAADAELVVTPAHLADTVSGPDWLLPACLGAGSLAAIAWAPDDAVVALATSLGVSLRSSASFEQVCFIPSQRPISQIAFSRDGALLTAATDAGIHTCRLTDMPKAWHQSTAVVGIATLAPFGSLIAFDTHTAVDILQTENFKIVSRIPISTAAQHRSVTFSPDGQLIALIIESGIQIRHIFKSTLLYTLSVATHNLRGIAFSCNAMLFAATSEQTITIWDLAHGQEVAIFESDQPLRGPIWFDPTDTSVAAIGTHAVLIWRIDCQSPTQMLDIAAGVAVAGVFNADGQKLAVVTREEVLVWDHAGDAVQRFGIGYQDRVTAVACGPAGQVAAACGSTVRLWQCNQATAPHSLPFSNTHLRGLAFDPSGHMLLIAQDHALELWSLATATCLDTIAGCSLHAGGAMFGGGGQVGVWVALAEFGTTRLPKHPVALAYQALLEQTPCVTAMPASDQIALVCDNSVYLYTLTNGQLLAIFTPVGVVNDIALAENGRDLAVALSHEVQIWRCGEPQPHSTFAQGAELVLLSPDTTLLAAVCNLVIVVWQLRTGTILARLIGHTDRICALAFSPDTRILASGACDGTVRVWPLNTYSGER
jgi:WD40 repeat protein